MSKERTQITQALCDHVRILLAGGATAQKAAEITKVGKATIYRIKAAEFDANRYVMNTDRRRIMDKDKAADKTIEMLQGQMKMELPAEEPKAEMSEQVKLMRFQAAQADKICEKITAQAVIINETLLKIYDMMGQILRAVRKE